MKNKSLKNQLKMQYGKYCMLCGRKARELQFHHLIPKSYGGETSIENGALLCKDCHEKIHKYIFLSLQYFKFTLEIEEYKIKGAM